MIATLALEDGTILHGEMFAAPRPVVGEIVFNTSMTGYQEVLTDPSYRGQMVVMTASHIGNTGVNREDVESEHPQVTAFIVRELSPMTSNWRSTEALSDYLARHHIPGISQVDTRYLTRIIRERGAMKAALAPGHVDPDELVARARAWPGLEGRDLVREVTCSAPYTWTQAADPKWYVGLASEGLSDLRPHVVAYDFGVKRNILRRLVAHGCRVTVVPADTTAAQVMALHPDGVFLSNGPGDPAGVPYAAGAVAELLETGLPIFGICLGHQILGLALGGRTYKLKFGHHGGNHPVRDVASGRVQITAQNHNYAVDPESLPGNVEITHWNLNDHTVEGMRLANRPVFSVQYHPEASPGPHDADYLFGQFVALMR
ncbi:MAG TPA: carbamoyl-phosphate synthase small subunit [Anaerolineae bacterium]|nr:carbamoyl-phosphate synthase small subunit [Anaerolineae bacterium]